MLVGGLEKVQGKEGQVGGWSLWAEGGLMLDLEEGYHGVGLGSFEHEEVRGKSDA